MMMSRPPRIISLTVNNDAVTQNERVTFTAQVEDPDGDLSGGELLYGGETVDDFNNRGDGEYSVTLSWQDVNGIDRFDFDVEGDTRDFTARFFDADGNSDTRDIEITFLCDVMGQASAACDGVCAADPEVGCRCDEIPDVEATPLICAGNFLYTCNPQQPGRALDCGDVYGTGARGSCVEDTVDIGAYCVMPVGQPCIIENPNGERGAWPCGTRNGIDANLGCIDDVCTRGWEPCQPVEDFQPFCAGDVLIYQCLNWGEGRDGQQLGLNCLALGGGMVGITGCQDGACVQGQAGGPCVPGLIECAPAAGACLDVDPEINQGVCQ